MVLHGYGPQHDLVAQGLGGLGGGGVIAALRRPEQLGGGATGSLDSSLAALDLSLVLRLGETQHDLVGPRMVADGVTFGNDPADEVGVGLGVAAHEEEGEAGVVLLRQLKDNRRVPGVGAVVEGYGDELLLNRHVSYAAIPAGRGAWRRARG